MNIPFKRTVFVLLFTSFLLVTCKDDDEPKLSACRLNTLETPSTRFIYEYEGSVVKSRSSISITSGAVIKKVTYVYNDAGDLIGTSAPGETGTLTYTNGQITKQEFEGATIFARTDYEYSGENLVKVQYYEAAGTNKAGYTTLEYSGSNVVLTKTFNKSGTQVSSVEYTYGDKYSPFLGLPVAYRKFLKLEDFSIGNNLLKYKSSNGTEIDYTSEFNSFGFPTIVIANYKDGAMDTRMYIYECN